MTGLLEKHFKLRENGTTARTEVLAGLTTFLTMAYIVVVNPHVLAGSGGAAGPPLQATVTATCIAAAVPTIAMGLWSNYPIALASGMGLNTALIAAVAAGQGVTWQTMMGVVFIEGLIITLLVLTGLREAVMNSIPMELKRSIGVGIGLFIALIGLHSAHWIGSTGPVGGEPLLVPPTGNFHSPATLVATAGILGTAALVATGARGALLLGIALTTLVAIPVGVAHAPQRIIELPDFGTFGRLDILGALRPALLGTIFAFLITDFFDTMGTVIAVGEQAGKLRPDGGLPRLKRVLAVDSMAAMWGGLCSASSVTSYIESAAGVGAGARTGLSSVVVGLLFLVAMFLAPLAQAVPAEATAAALVVVGFLMMRVVREIDFGDALQAIPAFLTILMIPLTMSISRGIGTGFIAHVVLHALAGRGRQVSPVLWALAALFALSFALEGGAA
ncbi:MAG: NCS2 family permease [Chthonomonadales bacterium]|nr:NCS2 family permease [Chthonomonadales bacterium]